jgi:hypothetical protein
MVSDNMTINRWLNVAIGILAVTALGLVVAIGCALLLRRPTVALENKSPQEDLSAPDLPEGQTNNDVQIVHAPATTLPRDQTNSDARMDAPAASSTPVQTASPDRAAPSPQLIKQVQADAKLLREMVYRLPSSAEVERWLQITHPDRIRDRGGEARLREKLLRGASAPTAKQVEKLFKIESVEFPDPPRHFKGAKHEFVIVPIRLTLLRADGIRDISDWFFLGGRTPGSADFAYVDVPRLTTDGAKAFFPDFPDDIMLPVPRREQIRPPGK